jgi:hypothetical protein
MNRESHVDVKTACVSDLVAADVNAAGRQHLQRLSASCASEDGPVIALCLQDEVIQQARGMPKPWWSVQVRAWTSIRASPILQAVEPFVSVMLCLSCALQRIAQALS